MSGMGGVLLLMLFVCFILPLLVILWNVVILGLRIAHVWNMKWRWVLLSWLIGGIFIALMWGGKDHVPNFIRLWEWAQTGPNPNN